MATGSSGACVQLPCHLEREEGHLRTHTWQGAEFVDGLRDVATKLVAELLRGLPDVPDSEFSTLPNRVREFRDSLRLAPPESDLAYGFGDDALVGPQDSVYGQGSAHGLAQLGHGSVCDLVFGLR